MRVNSNTLHSKMTMERGIVSVKNLGDLKLSRKLMNTKETFLTPSGYLLLESTKCSRGK